MNLAHRSSLGNRILAISARIDQASRRYSNLIELQRLVRAHWSLQLRNMWTASDMYRRLRQLITTTGGGSIF